MSLQSLSSLLQNRNGQLLTECQAQSVASVAWALQEQEGQTLSSLLLNSSEKDQQSLLQAYLPLLEQWEKDETAQETAHQEAELALRRPFSFWGVSACCLSRLRMVVLGQWSFAHLQACLPRLRRFFCLSPRQRPTNGSGFRHGRNSVSEPRLP